MKTPRILCISLAPALDRYLTVENFSVGGITRSSQVEERAGGKCINMARAMKQLGGNPLVIAALGGHTGEAIEAAARAERIDIVATRIESCTRQCTVIWDPVQETLTQLSENWNQITMSEWAAFIELVTKHVKQSSFEAAAFSGRMFPSVPSAEVASLVEIMNEHNLPSYVDAADVTLGALLAAKPTGVKINHEEASAYLGIPINTVEDAAKSCKEIVAGGVASCVITLGARGAVGATATEAYYVSSDDHGPWAVGSGDAFFGAMIVNRVKGASWLDTMTAGVAAGTANAHQQIAGLLDCERFDKSLKEIHIAHLRGVPSS
ncbi:MAG: hypothetical protein KC422_12730 [Trueperaceae bacterium]|nr:hypothetical protein [Trueperaceae bacterium]